MTLPTLRDQPSKPLMEARLRRHSAKRRKTRAPVDLSLSVGAFSCPGQRKRRKARASTCLSALALPQQVELLD